MQCRTERSFVKKKTNNELLTFLCFSRLVNKRPLLGCKESVGSLPRWIKSYIGFFRAPASCASAELAEQKGVGGARNSGAEKLVSRLTPNMQDTQTRLI